MELERWQRGWRPEAVPAGTQGSVWWEVLATFPASCLPSEGPGAAKGGWVSQNPLASGPGYHCPLPVSGCPWKHWAPAFPHA